MSAVISPPLSDELEALRPEAPFLQAEGTGFLIRVDGRPNGRIHHAMWVPGPAPDYEPLLVPACGQPMSPRFPAQQRLTRVVNRVATCQKQGCQSVIVPRLPRYERTSESGSRQGELW